ncbi:hypothetical protein CPB85DRAFT_1437834 [Mucidula mucida]|nr:hypothetical protein CPB85DRAFT_1437834 [Mucidula mucida]
MTISLENVNVSRAFTEPLDVPIMHHRKLLIDSLEFLWGLDRGQMSSYFEVAGNFLRVQPGLKTAIDAKDIALLPPNHIVEQLFEFQEQNRKRPLAQRRTFTEVFSFMPGECRVVPLKPGVSLYTLNPKTRKVTTLKGTRTSFPSVSCGVHPLFLLTYSCWELLAPPRRIDRKLGLGDALMDCMGPWHMIPPFGFYDGAYHGQFGRSVPFDYRTLIPRTPPVPDLVHSSSSSSSSYSSLGSRLSKRSRLSTPSQSDSEAGVDIAKWVSDCAVGNFSPDVDGPALDVVPCKPLDSPEISGPRIPKRRRS